jgi:hypothetical protein
MRLVQFIDTEGARRVAVSLAGSLTDDAEQLRVLPNVTHVYDLARSAMQARAQLSAIVMDKLEQATVYQESLSLLEQTSRLLPPLDHPDPYHCFVTGTGLTHLGSADTRNSMHTNNMPASNMHTNTSSTTSKNQQPVSAASEETLSDSMKMFQLGLAGGKPAPGDVGVQPEWFYKGNGHAVKASGHVLESPSFARDGGEEPEIVGLYVNDDQGTPHRIGFALGNEFSDHVTEKANYLYLAHSKLRPCAVGPELLLGDLPADVQGTSRIMRQGTVIWEKPFVSGEANMSHSLANLEHHHFKYPLFRQAGDVHVHFFGTATLSFADNISPQTGDVFEIRAPLFGQPLRNVLELAPSSPDTPVTVRYL